MRVNNILIAQYIGVSESNKKLIILAILESSFQVGVNCMFGFVVANISSFHYCLTMVVVLSSETITIQEVLLKSAARPRFPTASAMY